MKIARSQLDSLTPIAEGAFGRVYRVERFTLPGEADALAYKEFTSKEARQAAAAAACVDLWASLSRHERDVLGRYAAWPRALVTNGARTCGLLMPMLGDEFFYTRRNSATGAQERSPRAMSWLIATAALRAKAGTDIPDIDPIDRLVLVANLSYALALLHRKGWVYGDLSFANVAFALNPPRLRLLDCDAAAPLSNAGRKQGHTPFWEPPEASAGGLQDTATDTYKLGLAILRCLCPGVGGATTRDPARFDGELDDRGVELVTRALSDRPGDRPAAKDIYLHLTSLLSGRVAPPVILRAGIAQQFLLRGQDARLEWRVQGADALLIEGPHGERVELDARQHPRGHSFRPGGSGPVTLTASNRFGSVIAELGAVDLYELPKLDLGRLRLPQPRLGTLAAFTAPSVTAAVAGRPAAQIGAGVGPVPAIDMSRTLEGLRPFAAPRVAFPRWTASLDRAASTVGGVVAETGAAVASSVRAGLAGAQWDAGGRIR
jgi:hypothetical protein